ncbi:hypothetical protein SCLCIDRAFT_1219363 [Scleroderma citrinum Foug A]|uniref:BTB domain-containing protein n=1 Tax=Scleroderma citrinum Foug A TaxID=1036808 RepID=A0A0C3D9W3_9AGAM|nr:hypothetical protein SCLCIDRAFT_1219363 [Scleroderma citrinum Foug A]
MTDLKSARLNTLLLKSLLGEEIGDIKFYLFSSRSKHKGRIFRPRALHANSGLLSESLPYLADLLKGKKSLADHAMFEFHGVDNYPWMTSHNEYGYEDDSDLDEAEETEEENTTKLQDVTLALDKLTCATSNENDEGVLDREPKQNRHIFIKDTAFRTWKSLLFYFYTGHIQFTFLKSTSPVRFQGDTSGIHVTPTCSAKSMYRLASKMGFEALQTKALDYIRFVLSDMNVVTELGSPLLARHPPVLNTVLDTLFRHIDSPLVRSALPKLFERIANGELCHGADILKALYEKILAKHYPQLNPVPPNLPMNSSNAGFLFNVKTTFPDNFKKTDSASPKKSK